MGESTTRNDDAGRPVPRTELVWPGKYDAEGRRVEVPPRPEPLRTRESYAASDVDVWGAWDAWRSRLYFGDNLVVMDSLLEELGGSIDLIYIDPPFATGQDFSVSTRVGHGDATSRRVRSQPAIDGKAYRDAWGRDLGRYLSMLEPRLYRMRGLLAANGSIVVHLDRRVAHHVKFLLDEVFGESRAINEIIWCYTGPSSPGMKGFANKHDLLYWYANGDSWTFNVDAVRLPYNESTRRNEGRRTGFTTGNPDLVVKLHPLGKYPEDWWVLPVEAPASRRRTGYPTQKPERLLERVLLAATNEGDLVADLFCGSGTTLAVAERLGRRWIGCDSSPAAIHATRKRLLSLPRRHRMDVVEPASAVRPVGDSPGEVQLTSILRAYGAEPDSAAPEIHGRRQGEAVVVLDGLGIDRVPQLLSSCRDRGESEVHLLARRWRPTQRQRLEDAALAVGVTVVAVELVGPSDDPSGRRRGAFTFRPCPRVDIIAEVEGSSVVVSLTGLSYPGSASLPSELASRLDSWADLADFWAVDWAPGDDAFRPGFVAYRTAKRRSLELRSTPHAYPRGTRARIRVLVVDVQGIETFRDVEVEV